MRKKHNDEESEMVSNYSFFQLFKNVFNPDIGPSLAFIGFVQPASGGILTMSEVQARWFAELCKGKITLPNKHEMEEDISKENVCFGNINYLIYSNKCPGALQFRSPINDILETKYGQLQQNFNVLKPFYIGFSHRFPIKSGRGHLLEKGVY